MTAMLGADGCFDDADQVSSGVLAIVRGCPTSSYIRPAATASKTNSMNGRRCLSVKTADAILDWFIFPALLYIQFGVTLYCQQQQRTQIQPPEAGVSHIDVTGIVLIFSMITMFCVVAIGHRRIYRRRPRDDDGSSSSSSVPSLLLLLLPEIFTNVVLASVMLTDLVTAFRVLVVLTGLLTVASGMGLPHPRRPDAAAARESLSEPNVYKRLVHPDDDDGCDGEVADEFLGIGGDDDDDTSDDDEWVC
jgi:hypothetical protein